MPEEPQISPTSRRPSGVENTANRSRGPQFARTLLLFCLIIFFLGAIMRMALNAGRQYEKMSWGDFQQKHWNAEKQQFEGFDKAELQDDVLRVRPIDQAKARAAARALVKNSSTQTTTQSTQTTAPSTVVQTTDTQTSDAQTTTAQTSPEPAASQTTAENSAPPPGIESTPAATATETSNATNAATTTEEKATQTETSDAAAKTEGTTQKSELAQSLQKEPEIWYQISIPEKVLDSQMLFRLGTIPNFEHLASIRWVSPIISALIWVGLLTAFFYIVLIRPLRTQGGPGNVWSFGRSRPKLVTKESNTGIKFDDVAGIDEAKEEVTEVIEFLKNPEKFQRLGGRIPRGLLFVGPPGTGKTLLAKAIAGEAGVPFYSISGSDFVEMFVGVGASRVRDLFRQAKESAPCIIFLDEVDAVGRRRGSGLGGGHDEREQTLNAILVEMDGFDTNEQVIVIAATNRPDVLDPALLRPGRFDREVTISLPDLKGRNEILKVHARNVKLSDQVDLAVLARSTPMFSGAELAAIINEAAIIATMAGKEAVEQEDLEEARDKVRFGRQRRGRMVDEADRRMTAYHEAGHAMLMRLIPEVEPLHKVTIIPRGMALGSTMYLPTKDRYTISKKHLLGDIKVLYGGRIAEEMFCNDITTGASNDIERATEIARRMVCDFGMSPDLGPIRYTNKEQQVFLGGEVVHPPEYSDETARRIDTAVRTIIEECYKQAEAMLQNHRSQTELVAMALLKYETLTSEEVEAIIKENSIDAIRVALSNGAVSHPIEGESKTEPTSGTGAPATVEQLGEPTGPADDDVQQTPPGA